METTERKHRQYFCLKGSDKDFSEVKHVLYRSVPTEDRVPKVGELHNNWLKVEEVIMLTRTEFYAFF